ncbi:MAG: carboxypeptidase-like regulatory domain-containing protein, partial [Acidobacteria bacterium]|nr:carboxypeptidase-like regulatory domain-containing protein [Acidobacteriota bacterium]
MRLAELIVLFCLFLGCAHNSYAQTSPSASSAGSSDTNANTAKLDGVITGKVLGDDGKPVASVAVTAIPIGVERGSYQRDNSNDKGEFKLAGLRAGVYRFRVEVPGYVVDRSTAGGIYRIGDQVTINLTKGGVITGRVTDAFGEPIVGVSVTPYRVRELNNDRTNAGKSDDRGIYRIFGLEPGVYIVSITEIPSGGYSNQYFHREAPTYHPSSTRGSAVEITLHSGEEISGIDLRIRGDQGQTISGTLSGEINPERGGRPVYVYLVDLATKEYAGMAWPKDGDRFAFNNVPDGEYEIAAMNNGGDWNVFSIPRRVSVKGVDISGVDLRLVRMGSISGRVILEKSDMKEMCKAQKQTVVEEILLNTRRYETTEYSKQT